MSWPRNHGRADAQATSKALLDRTARAGLEGQLEDERRAVMQAADQSDFARRGGHFVRKNH